MEDNKKRFPFELRMNRNSGDWVVIATGRARRTNSFKKEKRQRKMVSKKDCPFCNIKNQEHPILFYNNGKEVPFKEGDVFPKKWTTEILPNKYPAFIPSDKPNRRACDGLFETMNAVGFHEVIIKPEVAAAYLRKQKV